MDKKGLIGKIFAVIGLIFLIILIIAGITAWQAYSLVMTVQQESASMQVNMESLSKGDCSKLDAIKLSINKIKSKATSACWNPIIKIAVDKMEQVPVKCKDIPTLENQMSSGLAQIKIACANQTSTALNIST